MRVSIHKRSLTTKLVVFSSILLLFIASGIPIYRTQQQVLQNPILFALVVPPLQTNSNFGHQLETFGNHKTGMREAPRGGDLCLMDVDGNIRFLTKEVGFGVEDGEIQAEDGIAVRQPYVHWSGTKALFSMVIGGPIAAFDQSYRSNRWQIYEITNLNEVVSGMTPNIVKVPNQPNYNNISPIYGSDDQIIYTSDHPLFDMEHTYPQKDEYESSDTNTGIFKLNPETGEVIHLTHSPSGDFDIQLASDGRIISTRWEHLKRDQQASNHRAGNAQWQPVSYESEAADAQVINGPATKDGIPYADADGTPYEIFPEAFVHIENGIDVEPNRDPNEPLHDFNEFLPWEITENGERHQTMNHVGRHEFGGVFQNGSKIDDPNLVFGLGNFSSNEYRETVGSDAGIFQIKEDPRPGMEGTFYGTWSREFSRFASGRIFQFSLPIGMNPQDMEIIDWTNPIIDNSGTSDKGHFRNPLMTMDGTMLVSHSVENGLFSIDNPYTFRIAKMVPLSGTDNPTEHTVDNYLTGSGFSRTIVYYGDNTEPISVTADLSEVEVVEIVARNQPATLPKYEVTDVEMQVIQEEGINIEELRQWMIENNLALIAIRNATERDQGESQQPFNLQVPGGVSSIPTDGKVYEISHLQIFGAELIRAYGLRNYVGRRVIATPLRDTPSNENLEFANGFDNAAPPGSTKIFPDGSIAAFVPATRALTWQTIAPDPGDSPDGVESVVRERQWVTFAPGEIRTCEGCHGINNKSHLGNNAPQNKPEALRSLLQRWKQKVIGGVLGFEEEGKNGKNGYYLYQNVPNPFIQSTSIRYELPKKDHVTISIYNLNGQLIKTLVDQTQTKGSHVIAWDGTGNQGDQKAGIYICTLSSGSLKISNKIVLASE